MLKFPLCGSDGEPCVLLASCLGDTDTGGGIVQWDGHGVHCIDRLSSMGLCLDAGRLTRVLRTMDDENTSAELLVYDQRGVSQYLRLDGVYDPHDVLRDGDHFILVSTRTNSIVWLDALGRVVKTWRADGEGDAWHLNCLWRHEGELYVSAFGRFPQHRGWDDPTINVITQGMIFHLATGEDVVTGLTTPHNPRYVNGRWVVCNSRVRQLLEINPATGAVERRLECAGFTRGLAMTDRYYFIGESAERVPKKTEVPLAAATIAVVDRRSWKIVERVTLPFSEIYDLALVPLSLAEGVRRGFRTNSHRVREQDQLAMFDQVGVRPLCLWAVSNALPPEACRVCVEAEFPADFPANAELDVSVEVKNIGAAIFLSEPPHPVHVAHKWFPRTRKRGGDYIDGLRTRLSRPLPPGERWQGKVKIRTPSEPGDYELRLTLVQEHVAWFDDLHAENALRRTVRIDAPTAPFAA